MWNPFSLIASKVSESPKIRILSALFAYLMFYTAPEEVTERVKVIAVTDEGCIAETMDGFAVNIGPCSAQEGDFIVALVDQKTKERAAAMNPTN